MSNPIVVIQMALECSVYISPRDYGLTHDEAREVAEQEGFLPGQIKDALASPLLQRKGHKLVPAPMGLQRALTIEFRNRFEPEYRDFDAFEFVAQELLQTARQLGAKNAVIPRDVLVERGVQKGHAREAIEVAIAVNILQNIFLEANGTIKQVQTWALPSASRGSSFDHSRVIARPEMARIHGIVEDIISRRGDGRPAASDAIKAFETCLAALGQDRFKTWWVQRRGELLQADPATQPTTMLVLAASLSEGALSFVVPRAQKHNLMSRVDASKPRQFRFEDLVKGARSSNPGIDPILDDDTAQRALKLNETRQRIHAGYLIDTIPTGPIPELKPEEAEDGLQTAKLVIRRIVDWLGRHP